MSKNKVDDGRPRCTECNKPLSNPKSIERGMGPVCWAKLKKRDKEKPEYDKTWEGCNGDPTDREGGKVNG